MTITQTVEITADRRSILVEIPREIPAGKGMLTFTPIAEPAAPSTPEIAEFADASTNEVMATGDEILNKHIAAFKALAN